MLNLIKNQKNLTSLSICGIISLSLRKVRMCMEYISEEKTIAVGYTKNPDMHGWVSLPDPMASGHTSNSRNTRDCLQSEEKSMSLGIILRKGDFFYYAADSRCKLLVDAIDKVVELLLMLK